MLLIWHMLRLTACRRHWCSCSGLDQPCVAEVSSNVGIKFWLHARAIWFTSVGPDFGPLDSALGFGRCESSAGPWCEPRKRLTGKRTQVRFTYSVTANGTSISFEPRWWSGFLAAAAPWSMLVLTSSTYFWSIFKSALWKWMKPNQGWKLFSFSHLIRPGCFIMLLWDLIFCDQCQDWTQY